MKTAAIESLSEFLHTYQRRMSSYDVNSHIEKIRPHVTHAYVKHVSVFDPRDHALRCGHMVVGVDKEKREIYNAFYGFHPRFVDHYLCEIEWAYKMIGDEFGSKMELMTEKVDVVSRAKAGMGFPWEANCAFLDEKLVVVKNFWMGSSPSLYRTPLEEFSR